MHKSGSSCLQKGQSSNFILQKMKMIHPPAFFLQKGWSTANYLEHSLVSCKRTDQCNMFFVCKLSRSLALAGLLQRGERSNFLLEMTQTISPGLFLQRGWSGMSFSFSLHNSASSCLVVSCKKDGRMCHFFCKFSRSYFLFCFFGAIVLF